MYKVCLITATAGRHQCIERSVRFFLDQNYKDCYQLIYQNSPFEQRLSEDVPKDRVILINQHLNSESNQPYTNLGQIYRDAIKHVLPETEVVNFFDDDDIFLPNHVSEGVEGLMRCGKLAYKPYYSYYKGGKRTFAKMVNTFEPSIFVNIDHIKQYGFSDTTTEQHLQWVHPLIDAKEIYSDPEGKPTLVYDWSGEMQVFKTSGNASNPENFNNYRNKSVDHGDGVITPLSSKEARKYYDRLIK